LFSKGSGHHLTALLKQSSWTNHCGFQEDNSVVGRHHRTD
jgi:hypothetical protein